MPLAGPTHPMTPDEYLAWASDRPEKNEYVDGQVYAMSGGTDAHVTIAGNLFAMLRSHLRGGPCRAFVVDMKVRVSLGGPFFYPDVVVTSDERDRATERFKEHPLLVVEVLSPNTAAFDRGRKFAWYRQIEALREYVLVDPEARSVELDDRGEQVLVAPQVVRCPPPPRRISRTLPRDDPRPAAVAQGYPTVVLGVSYVCTEGIRSEPAPGLVSWAWRAATRAGEPLGSAWICYAAGVGGRSPGWRVAKENVKKIALLADSFAKAEDRGGAARPVQSR